MCVCVLNQDRKSYAFVVTMLFRNECQEWQPRWLWLWLRFQRFAVAAVVWKNSKLFQIPGFDQDSGAGQIMPRELKLEKWKWSLSRAFFHYFATLALTTAAAARLVVVAAFRQNRGQVVVVSCKDISKIHYLLLRLLSGLELISLYFFPCSNTAHSKLR